MTPQGELVVGGFDTRTLVVAVKDDCLGCRNVLESPLGAFGDVATLLVSSRPSADPSWRTTQHRLVISELLMDELDVRWPPFYVLIDPANEKVMSEGVVFGVEQVREEIAPFLM